MPRRATKVDEQAIEIYKLKVAGKRNKEIAQELGLHPSTVSVKIKKMREALKEIDEKVERGEITLREAKGTTALSIPQKNPFEGLQTFNELAGISSAGGAVFGAAAAEVIDGFNRDDLPYEERMVKVMRGASALGGGILSLYVTVKQLSESMKTPEQREEEEKKKSAIKVEAAEVKE